MVTRQQADIVVIGGGAIGLSVAYHLGMRGASNVLLLERNVLTSGTSWHAAGIVGPLRASMNLTRLAKYAVNLFQSLEADTGQGTGYAQTGGMWLAACPERLVELERIRAMGEMSGLDTAILKPDQIGERLTLLHTADLSGALWVEQDGQVNPVDLCMAYAKGARGLGVEIREQVSVSGFITEHGRVTGVRLSNGGLIECEKVVNCAGAWARDLGRLAGVNVPLQAVEHIYVVTEPIPGLPRPVPIVRDLDAAVYLKGDAGKLVIGTFESNPRLWHPGSMRDDPGYLQFAEDLDHVEPMLAAVLHRVPELANHGITHFMNGPESFTPDTRQLMGEAPELDNFFVAAGFNSIGIMSSAGVGRVMAQWVLERESPMDLWEVDLSRMDPLTGDSGFLARRTPEAVSNQFAMHWPYKQFKSGRGLRRSAWHQDMAAAGAVFGAPTGWERPLWFAAGEEGREIEYSYGAQCWWPAARREALQLMNGVSLIDLSPFSKFRIRGKPALGILQRLCSNDIDVDPGRVVYTLVLNRRGGIEAEFTVTRVEDDEFLLVAGAAARFRELARLRRCCAGNPVRLDDISDEYAVIGVAGPHSRQLLQSLCAADLSATAMPFASSRTVDVGSVPARLTRISFSGELGYELYIPVGGAAAVYQALYSGDHGLAVANFGLYCLDSCRLEKAFRHWGHDFGPDDSPLETGLAFAVRSGKSGGFTGSDAIERLRARGLRRHNLLFEVVADSPLLLHDEPVHRDGRPVGRTTSGGLGFRTGKALAFATIGVEQGEPLETAIGRSYEIEIAGHRYPLRALERPPYDPDGSRLRS